jgi:HSP20 family molecular chaperone IbpA
MIVIRRHRLPFNNHGMPEPCNLRKLLFLNNLPQVVLQTTTNKAENQAQASASEESENDKSNNTIEHQNKLRTHFQKVPIHCDETDESVSIALDVSGFGADELKVSLEDHVLSLFGKRRNKVGDTFIVHHRFSLNRSAFDEESIKANLSEGILEISVHKKPEPKARLIPIFTEETKAPVVDTKETDKKAGFSSTQDDEELLPVSLGHALHEDTEAAADTAVVVETVDDAEEEEKEESDDTKAAENGEKKNVSATKVATEEWEEHTWEEVTHTN